MNVPAMEIPSYRYFLAKQNGVHKKLLFRTHGGLGDYITAEPAIRWGIKKYKDDGFEFYVETDHPELFQHLHLNDVFDRKKEKPIWKDYFVFNTLWHPDSLHGDFVSQLHTQPVDYSALVIWKSQLPLEDRNITLSPTREEFYTVQRDMHPTRDVVIHPGKGWETKTLPSSWWNEVIHNLIRMGFRPVLIGKTINEHQGTVDVFTKGCLDLRDKLSIMQTVSATQIAKVVLTNDSAPLHMAASGDAWIGFMSFAKRPEYLTHWRPNKAGVNEFGWRMQSFGYGGIWDKIDLKVEADERVYLNEGDIEQYLPDPDEVYDWVAEKMNE